MNIWWCEEHESQKHSDHQSASVRCFWVIFEGLTYTAQPCRMVEMRLLPVDDKT